jgi:hypothetical protein
MLQIATRLSVSGGLGVSTTPADTLEPQPPLPEASASAQIREILDAWQPELNSDLECRFQLSEKSLAEVKHLTEYEDEKANRILTAVAFLSALAGVLYIGLLPGDMTDSMQAGWRAWLAPVLYHVFFGLYGLCTVAGAIFVIKAVRPRFNIPEGWAGSQRADPAAYPQPELPPSFLFFEMILKVSPAAWARAFTMTAADDLKIHYLKNYIHESYLVADKIRAKLKPLQRGTWLLQVGVILLAVWVPICMWNAIARSVKAKPDGQRQTDNRDQPPLSAVRPQRAAMDRAAQAENKPDAAKHPPSQDKGRRVDGSTGH